MATAKILDNAAIVIYSKEFCRCRETTLRVRRRRDHILQLQILWHAERAPTVLLARGLNDSPALHLKPRSCICCNLSSAPRRP